MSSSSAGDGDGRPHGQPSLKGKIKLNSTRNHDADKNWTLVSDKPSQRKSSNSFEPFLPNFQHILDKHPVLNIDRSTLNCKNTLFPHNDPHIEPLSVDSNLSQGITKSSPIKVLDNYNTFNTSISSNTISINYISTRDFPKQQTVSSLNPNVIIFSEDFKGFSIIIVESTSKDSNMGNIHHIKISMLFFNKFKSI